jgi:hypothetical protein
MRTWMAGKPRALALFSGARTATVDCIPWPLTALVAWS